MFSLNDLPGNQVLDVIHGVDRDLTELKAAQRVGGASLVTHYNTTDAAWDVEEVVPSSTTFIHWRVVFTPDSGTNPFSLLSYDYELSPTDSTRPLQAYPDPSYVGPGIAYIVAFTNNNFSGSSTLKFKVAVTSMDTGTLAVTKVFSA